MDRMLKVVFRQQRTLLLFWMMVSSLGACFAAAGNTIAGTVRNDSTGKAVAGDEVILLRLLDGMQEEARTRTDAQGGFSFNVQYPASTYLVRVMHQEVNYDQRATAGISVTVNVFDAASRVKDVSGSIEIIRVGSGDKSLHVSDMYDIRNASNPPLTQTGERTFEVYLPPKAKIDSVMAASNVGIGTKISAIPVRGEPGHYTVNFPLRPGDTKFAVNYDLPYDGRAAFHPRLLYPVQQMAVMFSPAMTFHSSSAAFHSIISNQEYQVQVVDEVQAGPAPGFEISGDGPLPALTSGARPQQPSRFALANPPGSVPERSIAANAGKRDISGSSQDPKRESFLQLWIAGGAGILVLGFCGLRIWQRRMQRALITTDGSVGGQGATLIEALKEELFQLEADRIHGSISREEYVTTKQALDETVRRAMAKAATQK